MRILGISAAAGALAGFLIVELLVRHYERVYCEIWHFTGRSKVPLRRMQSPTKESRA